MTVDEYTRLADDGCPNTGEHVSARRGRVWYRIESACEYSEIDVAYSALTLRVTPLVDVTWVYSQG